MDEYEWCVQIYGNEDGDGDPLFHTHVATPILSVELAGATAGLAAIEANVSLKDAKVALLTCSVGLDPEVCAQQDRLRQELHGASPAVTPPAAPGGHRLH